MRLTLLRVEETRDAHLKSWCLDTIDFEVSASRMVNGQQATLSTMRALEGSAKALYLGFFASHIVFTLIVDVQAILPPFWVPAPLRSLLAFYAATFNDPLMKWPTPLWFRSVVMCEMAFQLPFFFVACHQIAREPNPSSSSSSSKGLQYYPGWFRNACVAYGAHTATTLVPILATLVSSPTNSPAEKVALV